MTLHFLTSAACRPERSELLALAALTGLFTTAEAEELLGALFDSDDSPSSPLRNHTLVVRAAGNLAPLGWAYFAPDPYASGVWNLWWIGVHPAHAGTGAGRHLLTAVESTVREQGARVIVVETSEAAPLARARRFYEREGYHLCGVVPAYYGEHEGKMIYAKRWKVVSPSVEDHSSAGLMARLPE